jgi:uncharacterized coiled-coil protein SlyX
MTYEVVHLIGRIAALEIAVATAHQIAQTASSEVAELQAAIDDLKSEIEDLQDKR